MGTQLCHETKISLYNILEWEPSFAMKQRFLYKCLFWISDMLQNEFNSILMHKFKPGGATSSQSCRINYTSVCLRWITFHWIFRLKDIFYFYIYLTFYLQYELRKASLNYKLLFNSLTLFVLRYLKTRIRWGGVNLTPPPL